MPNECLMNHDEQLVRREATINLYEGYDRVPKFKKILRNCFDISVNKYIILAGEIQTIFSVPNRD